MDTVIIAVGSNVGDRHQHLKDAYQFLSTLSETPVRASPIYLTEPVGPSTRYFLNGVIEISSSAAPKEVLPKLKKFERRHGRSADQPRWSARTIDLDIISFGDLVIQNDTLIIPHPEYQKRLFVLEPLKSICPDWHDPKTGVPIDTLIANADLMHLKKTTLRWYHGK